MDLDVYRKRLNVTSSSDAIESNTISHVQQMFKNSPQYEELTINSDLSIANNGVVHGVRFSYGDSINHVRLLLEPSKETQNGSYVYRENDVYIVTEYKPNKVYPKAKCKLCNQKLRWKDSSGTSYEYPVLVDGKNYSIKNEEYFLMPDGSMVAKVQYNTDTKSIELQQRFIFGNKAYEVTGIDDMTDVVGSNGILNITLEYTTKTETDNVTDGYADNENTGSGWGDW